MVQKIKEQEDKVGQLQNRVQLETARLNMLLEERQKLKRQTVFDAVLKSSKSNEELLELIDMDAINQGTV